MIEINERTALRLLSGSSTLTTIKLVATYLPRSDKLVRSPPNVTVLTVKQILILLKSILLYSLCIFFQYENNKIILKTMSNYPARLIITKKPQQNRQS